MSIHAKVNLTGRKEFLHTARNQSERGHAGGGRADSRRVKIFTRTVALGHTGWQRSIYGTDSTCFFNIPSLYDKISIFGKHFTVWIDIYHSV